MNINRIKVLGLLGLPLLAIAVAVMVFAFNSSADTTEAATTGTPEMSLSAEGGGVFNCAIVSKLPKDPNVPVACVALGQPFTVVVNADVVPAAGYVNAGAWVFYGDDLGAAADGAIKGDEARWVDCAGLLYLRTNTDQGGTAALDSYSAGCITGTDPLPVSNAKGALFAFDLTCTDTASNQTLDLIDAGVAPAGSSGALFVEGDGTTQTVPITTDLEINCSPGPTATPTATPPPIPKMSKSPALQNVFLTRQGAKIPSVDCLAAPGIIRVDEIEGDIFGVTNIGSLAEGLNQDIVSADPKNPTAFQQLAAFEFEVHYDNKKVCVDITVGAAFDAAGAVCIVEDDEPDSKPQLEGVARIGCVTIGKDHGIDNLEPLASVDVYPQPEIYSQAKPNQDNGVVVQINNVNCDLGDEQGHAIPIFSCDDADITFRYLEGDVEPDCVIDAIDAQAIAFRWGVEKGSLIYKDFMNLEPSSQQQDNDIDINDLQFVFGRFGSTCEAPHPPQDPVNPKA